MNILKPAVSHPNEASAGAMGNPGFALLLVLVLAGCGPTWPDSAADTGRPPKLHPDYSGIVIPSNIAPLNFVVREQADRVVVRLSGQQGTPLVVSGRKGVIRLPAQQWRKLLEQNRGGELQVEVAVRDVNRAWHRFQAVTNRIASEPIDRYVVYRLLSPIDHLWRKMGIYQRDLETFRERTVLENQSFSYDRNGCLNCHSFSANRTDRMSFQIRSKSFGKPMVVVRDGTVTRVDTTASGFSNLPAAYHAWHPDGRRIAFSVNKVSPFEHTVGEHRDVWDNDSDLAVYILDSNEITTVPAISDPGRRETWPSWSADGKSLYFCSAPQIPFERFYDVKYDLMRIPYDPSTGAWGQPETLVSATNSGMSAAQPRESPDGRWVLFSLSPHGSIPIFQPGCDLYLLDRITGKWRLLDINSEWSDSWHCWSKNGRWIVFSSKRNGGVLARPYFSYFDTNGVAHKPLVMPQGDPEFYDSLTLTYNVPELVTGLVSVSPARLGRAICATNATLRPAFIGRKGEGKGAPKPDFGEWQSAGGH